MRVLIVSHYFWPEQFRINDLALGLKARGHEVTVLTGMPNYPEGRMYEGYSWWSKRRDEYEGVPLIRIPLFLRREGRGWQLALNYLSFVIFGVLLGPWFLRGKAFDVIFVFAPSPFTVGIPAAMLRWLKKAPMLFWVQDLWPESLASAGNISSAAILGAVGRVVRWIYRRCDRVLVQSSGFVEPAVAAGAPRKRILYLPNWSEDFYRPVALAADAPERQEMPGGFRVIFAGNMGEAQSLETIVGAARILREHADIHWIMIGDGRRRQWLQDEVGRQGVEGQFSFPGRKPAETMPCYFAMADALLVTLRDEPAFAVTIPSKVQSYLACGRPVVAALNGQGATVVNDSGAGIAVAAGDAVGLADAVLSMSRMEEAERRSMGQSGRDYYEANFERDMLITRLEQWMGESITSGDLHNG